ncbi:unnamed protein product [Adineta steineri]|uniref:Uncharacterized protein n=2 Tax=Adineta steineri TaxID=433720 RepID=A0A813ZZE1_9BILA|nr:unnamed protein product [Adineta steineri]CAF1258588.1 unnamed protein product [Adineta steineri]CAF3987098.1 unnamed protein product [Adineta steineri]
MFGSHLLHHHHIPHAAFTGYSGGNFAAPSGFNGSFAGPTGFAGSFPQPTGFTGGLTAPTAFPNSGFSGLSFGGGGNSFPAGFGSPYGYSPF